MLAQKALVLGYSLVLPLVVLDQPWPLVALGWLLGHAVCGLAIALISRPPTFTSARGSSSPTSTAGCLNRSPDTS
jgi:hypothetical protein